MLTDEKALEIIVRALRNLEDELGFDHEFEIGVTTPLFGPDATLDSLALVSVIVDVESDLSAALGYNISLTDDRAMNQQQSPFDDVQTLLNYIMILAGERDS